MKILILDDDKNILQILTCFMEVEKDWQFVCLDKNDYSNIKEDIDLILVDFATGDNEEILNTILEKNINAKTIVISERLKNSEEQGCDFCLNNYNRKRLFKPIEPRKLYDLIKNFDTTLCSYYNTFNNIESIISTIIKRFPSLSYEDETKRINIEGGSLSNRHTYEFISFINILEQNDIQYNVLDEYQIQIK